MKVDLHNHTKLCNHAKGEMEEYVQKAIEIKTEYFGFSDHAPMEFDKRYRMNIKDMDFYENEVKRLREKYKDKIEIFLGYEVDYLKGYIQERVLKAKVDYLIGSVHFIEGWGFDNPEFIGKYKNKDIDKIWQDYFDEIEKMAKSGLFQIAGHLDLIKIFNFKPKKDVRLIAKDAIKAIKRSNMSVELNSAGFRKPVKECYPGDKLLELIKENDITVTFGSDAHKIEQIGYKTKELEKKAKEFGYDRCALFRNKEREMINF